MDHRIDFEVVFICQLNIIGPTYVTPKNPMLLCTLRVYKNHTFLSSFFLVVVSDGGLMCMVLSHLLT